MLKEWKISISLLWHSSRCVSVYTKLHMQGKLKKKKRRALSILWFHFSPFVDQHKPGWAQMQNYHYVLLKIRFHRAFRLKYSLMYEVMWFSFYKMLSPVWPKLWCRVINLDGRISCSVFEWVFWHYLNSCVTSVFPFMKYNLYNLVSFHTLC